jgi:eukaryotic-like serine/threonine-protein kinase
VSLTTGQKLGPYEIIAPAGAGGMGEIYKAKDTRLDRIVAIKVLPSVTAGSADLRARFEREARAISSLSHPNICTLHDIGHQDGIDFLVLEYLEGESLAERLRKGAMPTEELLRIAIQIADALDKAHKQGLVHRDVKPGNVMLTKSGAKLLDFGLAKLQIASGIVEGVTGITQTTPLTGQGTILGTIQYMAPEQLEGIEADGRSDIFAFGAMLYEMATGQKAFSGNSQASLIASILKEEPRAISELQPMTPPMLERAIKQCLSKDPDQRWHSAGDLKRALQWASEGGSQVGIPATLSRRRKSREWVLIGVSAMSLLLAGYFGMSYFIQSLVKPHVVRSTIIDPGTASFNNQNFTQFAISPDGQSLAYIAQDTGTFSQNLWVRPLRSYVAMKLPGTEGAAMPFWSPDSRYVAYFANGKIKKILATSGPSLLITDSARVPRGGSWGKNDIILFTPNMDGVIYKVSAAGGKAEPFTVLDSLYPDYTHRWASFLPNGNDFLFFARVDGGNGGPEDAICIGSLDSKEVKRLVKTKSNAVYADGHILYAIDGVLMAQPFNLSTLFFTSDAVPIVDDITYTTNWSLAEFSVSPEGSLVYRNQKNLMGSQLLVMDRTGTVMDSIGPSEKQYSPFLSPDEKRLAIDITNQQSTSTNIWTYDLVTKIRTRLTFTTDGDLTPQWSPDGQRIAYFHGGGDKKEGIYTVSVSGVDTGIWISEMRPGLRATDWTADGKFIIAHALDSKTEMDIWVIPADGSSPPFAYLQSEFAELQGRVSPDGRWMAYSSTESGKEEVYVSQFPKPLGKWQVSNHEGDRPRWSRDGKKIFYTDNSDFICEADVNPSGIAFEVGQIRQLFRINGARPGLIYDVFGNGERFVVNQNPEVGESRTYLNLVQNWVQEIKK